jgi:hypothetical protein
MTTMARITPCSTIFSQNIRMGFTPTEESSGKNTNNWLLGSSFFCTSSVSAVRLQAKGTDIVSN